MNYENMLFSKGPVVAVFGGSLGDEGKGKVASMFENVDYVAVATGGGNAGHTVKHNGKDIILHELPGASIIQKAKIYIGQGRVVNISGLHDEIKDLENNGINMQNRVIISGGAHLIFDSLNKRLDGIVDSIKSKSVGTTKKGIGIAYALKALRTSINFNIFLNDEKTVNDFVKVNCELFDKLNISEILEEIKQEKELLNELIEDEYISIDSNNLLLAKERKNNKKILVEASQSAMLSIDGGMYPFCTSSDTSVNGILSGLNLPSIDTSIAVFKAIKSKVGGGFFPTKFPQDIADKYRKISNEFGATTKRPRDVGYFDAVEANSVFISKKIDVLFITKADMLSSIPEVKIGYEYELQNGKKYKYEIPTDMKEYNGLKVNYSESFSIQENIYDLKNRDDLPDSYVQYFDALLKYLDFDGKLFLGTGPERDQLILF